jgi:hypothetical protein
VYWGWPEDWGLAVTLIDGQECPSYFTGFVPERRGGSQPQGERIEAMPIALESARDFSEKTFSILLFCFAFVRRAEEKCAVIAA